MLTLPQWVDESLKQIEKDIAYYRNINDNKQYDWAIGYQQALLDLKDFMQSRERGDTYWEERFDV